MNAIDTDTRSNLSQAPRRWEAVLRRDRAADGEFVYAVATTGVYCRPSCAARRPRRENVAFFDSPDAARAAGFRACRRCRLLLEEYGERSGVRPHERTMAGRRSMPARCARP